MGAGATKIKSKKIEPITINFITYRKEDAYYCTIEREKYKLQNDIILSFEKYNSFSTDQEVENVEAAEKVPDARKEVSGYPLFLCPPYILNLLRAQV